MNEKVLKKLEFQTVRDALADRCRSQLGKPLAGKLSPSASQSQVAKWLDQVREMQQVKEGIGLPPLGSIRDVRLSVKLSGKPTGVEPEALADIGATLDGVCELWRWGQKLPEEFGLLRTVIDRVTDLTPLAEKIHETIDPRGEVRDYASSKLASIRGTIAKSKSQIDIVFDRILRHQSVTRYLQYAGVTFHNDRKVLPLRAEYRGRVNGIIHRSSDSGATLFVEPQEVVELNNAIVRLRDDERKEISRIVSQLSRVVHQQEREILDSLGAAAVLDLLVAKVRYAEDFQAVVPELSDDRKLYLREARHPVLQIVFDREAAEGGEKREVVPISMRLGDDFDILIVTGPNTGGKTIALKTVGLLAAMTQAGVPIPAEVGSRMPIFKNLFMDIGDEQSIEQSLSTFSSHLKTILDMLKRAGEHSLVLIDELGAGTDPDEGAAIGRAVVDELLRLKAYAVITTHLSTLKAAAFTEDRVDNACVEFDVETLRPLYRLKLGEPGNSNAIVIAQRLGMSKSLVKSARSHLDRRQQALQKAIDGTLKSRRRAEAAREEAEQARMDAERKRRDMEQRERELAEAQNAHNVWVDWVNRLREGDEVFLRSFDRAGKLVRVQFQKQTALVNSGAMEIEVRLQDLQPPEPDA